MDEPAALRHHGDRDALPGLVDLAVNVRAEGPPGWLRERLAATMARIAAYPDATQATAAVGRRHNRPSAEVLLTAGAAEAFVLLARVLAPRHAVVVHPQFTEPEAALIAAGHPVERLELRAPFTFDPEAVADDADLVVVGNPTNPTSVLHPALVLAGLCRPGRVVLVDEAFADTVPGEPESLAARRDLPGLVVVRSLTKTWGLAGLRVGYLLADSGLVYRLREAQPLWAVSTPALEAAVACSEDAAVREAEERARDLTRVRDDLVSRLCPLDGVDVVPGARASFLLMRFRGRRDVREALHERGFAVRRGETFPGLTSEWVRVALRDSATNAAFAAAVAGLLADRPRA